VLSCPDFHVTPEFAAVGSAIETNYDFSSSPFSNEGAVRQPSVVASEQYHPSLRHLSRAVFVNFEWVENTIPTIVDVEDRHVKDKHWIVHSPAAAKHSSPFARKAWWRSFHSRSFSRESSILHFSSRVHSFVSS
jgi:hypothetical protein